STTPYYWDVPCDHAFLVDRSPKNVPKPPPQQSGWYSEESSDEFAKDDYLIKVANSVDALKNNKKFQDAVEKGTYDAWAMRMSKSFDTAEGVQSTPTIKINDKVIENPSSVADWEKALKDAKVTK
ncbi:thioredoxin domain-containing protein, partial [Streptomyces sp. NPDC005047]